MLSVCHSLIKTTSKQRAACISRCSLVDSNRTIYLGMFSRSLSNCIKFAIFAALICRRLRQFHVATSGKTQGGHHPTTSPHNTLQTNRNTTSAVACGHFPTPCAKNVLFQNAVDDVSSEIAQVQTLNQYNNFDTLQMNHSIS